MLGKRQRSKVMMPRTTSMASVPSAAKQVRQGSGHGPRVPLPSLSAGAVGIGAGGGVPAPRKESGDLAGGQAAAFLKLCGYCGGHLGPGKDTYIYRGEVAFCSQECRELLIESVECMEKKCSLLSIKEATSVSVAGASDQSGSSAETVAAA